MGMSPLHTHSRLISSLSGHHRLPMETLWISAAFRQNPIESEMEHYYSPLVPPWISSISYGSSIWDHWAQQPNLILIETGLDLHATCSILEFLQYST